MQLHGLFRLSWLIYIFNWGLFLPAGARAPGGWENEEEPLHKADENLMSQDEGSCQKNENDMLLCSFIGMWTETLEREPNLARLVHYSVRIHFIPVGMLTARPHSIRAR